MNEPLVRAREVSRTIGRTQILAPTSLDVVPGACTAIIGPNGSGKTTLLRIVLGRDIATSGSLRLHADLQGGRRAASLLGRPPFYEQLTVLDHLRFIAAAWGLDARAAAAETLLDRLGVRHVADRFPAELSSGEEQLVALSLVLVRPASLIVLDEPEQRLDAPRRERVTELLRERRSAGTGILLVTHHPALRATLADETCVLEGR